MVNEQPPPEVVRELPAPQSQAMLPATQTQMLAARYELFYLACQFVVSLAVLVGAFMVIVTYDNAQAVGGAVAVATLVVSYWFGTARTLPRH